MQYTNQRMYNNVMVPVFLSVFVPLVIWFFLPRLIQKMYHRSVAQTPLLTIACLTFFISWYLPSPLINGQDMSSTTHFVGGGIFCGLLWIYLKQTFKWQPKHPAVIEPLSLYALVSALGVFNELFEFVAVHIGLLRGMPLNDTSWDLVANTLGAFIVYTVYLIVRKINS